MCHCYSVKLVKSDPGKVVVHHLGGAAMVVMCRSEPGATQLPYTVQRPGSGLSQQGWEPVIGTLHAGSFKVYSTFSQSASASFPKPSASQADIQFPPYASENRKED